MYAQYMLFWRILMKMEMSFRIYMLFSREHFDCCLCAVFFSSFEEFPRIRKVIFLSFFDNNWVFFCYLNGSNEGFFPLPFLHLFTEDHISSSNNCIHKTKEKQQHQIKISLIILAVDKTMKIDREGVREKHMKKNEKTNRKYMSLLLFKTK